MPETEGSERSFSFEEDGGTRESLGAGGGEGSESRKGKGTETRKGRESGLSLGAGGGGEWTEKSLYTFFSTDFSRFTSSYFLA